MGKMIVYIDAKTLQTMFTQGWNIGKKSFIECIEGLPKDAKFIEFEKQYYFGRQEIMAIFEHESFENKEGEKLPYMSIIYHEIMNPEYIFTNKLKFLLFGDDYTEHVSPEMLTDEKLLEAVRMLKEVY
ncbi:MAG: hypothetical protein UW18_C0011G0014 [Microgenomates group bacterium GW2011_GWF1_44_10]|nr:MAG: hypothetical protein UW18_C0011G0014 [Microgenomates group bacterium GW2011_GWF1_44_10]